MKVIISFLAFLLFLSCNSGKSEVYDEEMTDDFSKDDDEIIVDDEEEAVTPFEESCEYYKAKCGEIETESGKLSCGECPDNMSCGMNNIRNLCTAKVCKYGYCWVNPYPQGDSLFAGDFLDNGDMFFVTDSTVFSKKGSLFENISYQLRSGGDFTSIIVLDEDSVWASATDGSLLKLENNFISCLDAKGDYHSPVKSGIYELAGKSHDDIFAASRLGILHYDGKEWKHVHETQRKINTVTVMDDFVVGAGEGIITVKNNGAWSNRVFAGDIVSSIDTGEEEIAALVKKEEISEVITINSSGGWESLYELQGKFNKLAFYKGDIIAGGDNGIFAVNEKIIDFRIPRNINGFRENDGILHIFGSHGWMAQWDGVKLNSNQGFFEGMATSVYASSTSSVWLAIDNLILQILPNSVNYFHFDSDVDDIFGKSEDEIYAKTENGFLKYNDFLWKKIEDPGEDVIENIKENRKERFSKEADSVSWKFGGNYTFRHQKGTISIADKDGNVRHLSSFPSATFDEKPVGAMFLQDDSFIAAGGNTISEIKDGKFDQKITNFEITAIDSDGTLIVAGDSQGNVHIIDGENIETVSVGTDLMINSVSISSDNTIAAVSDENLYVLESGEFKKIKLNDHQMNFVKVFSKNAFLATGYDIVIVSDGTDITETLPKNLVDRGLPTGETEVDMKKIFAIDENNIWVIGSSPDGKTSYIFSYNGTKWINDARSALYDEFSFTDVWACDQNRAYISLDSLGYLFHYKNITTQGFIESVDNPLGAPIYAISADPQGRMYIFGEHGIVMEYENPCLN
jgi:hypothetical protein